MNTERPEADADAALRSRLELLEARERLNEATDEALELAVRDRRPLEGTLGAVLPLLVAHTGAAHAWVRTYDENLALRDFAFRGGAGDFPIGSEAITRITDKGEVFSRRTHGGGHSYHVVAQPLDVAGELFGAAGVALDLAGVDESQVPVPVGLVRALLQTWCEELDNHLAAIAQARRKARVTSKLSEALRRPVLEHGVSDAIQILQHEVPFEDLLLVFRHQEDPAAASLHYKVVQDGTLTHDSRSPDQEVDEFIRAGLGPLLAGSSEAFFDRFGIHGGREEVLISGLRGREIVGRLIVTNPHGDFNSHDRDLLERFVDFLRQRIVDFNREWRALARSFAPGVVRQLLELPDYSNLLQARTAEVAILYADISGFTRISEQILGDPRRIGALVNVWGRAAVDILWEHGGVFDKMVGDCVIGLWGPPFFEMEPAEACARAADAALAIRSMTRTLGDGAALPELAGVDIDISAGIHFGSLFVGQFGPDDDYTGFSSAMNNAARLQGQARPGEILAMDALVEILGAADGHAAGGHAGRFGEERSAQVKNVAAPLRFRPLLE